MWYALILADLAQAGLFLYRMNLLPPQIPLFYSRAQGEDQLADLWMIAILPILMNGLIILNSYILRRFFPGNIFVKHTILYLNLFLIITLTFIFARILFLIS